MNTKIVLLSYDYPPNDGGISRLAAAFVTSLASTVEKIEVCTVINKEIDSRLERPSLPTRELPTRKFYRDLALVRYLLSLPKDSKIIATVWNPEATLAYISGHRNLYVLAHGNEVMPYPAGLRYKIKSLIRSKILTSVRCVVCNSRYTQELVLDIAPDAKTLVLNPGVDIDLFRACPSQAQARKKLDLSLGKKILLSVSRIDKYKGHDVVLEALAELPKEQLDKLHYVVAGKGSHLEFLKCRANELGLAAHISWLGFVPEEKLPLLYKSSDLFVLCTREDKAQSGVEGFGMVFLEAQAAGLPVVGTRAGGIPDAIKEGSGGWLIDQGDSKALVLILHKLLNSPHEIKLEGVKALSRANEACSWEQYTKKFLNIMEEY